MGLPVAPVGLRYRAAYQNAVREGLAVQEHDPESLATVEVNALWEHVARELWPTVAATAAPCIEGDHLALVS